MRDSSVSNINVFFACMHYNAAKRIIKFLFILRTVTAKNSNKLLPNLHAEKLKVA